MSDGITDAYRSVVTTTFNSRKAFLCGECGAKTRSQTCWWDGKYHSACDECAQKAGVT